MTSYYTVDRDTMDHAAGEAVVSVREAIERASRLKGILDTISTAGGVDELTTRFEYTADEAYRLRLVFDTLTVKFQELAPIMEIARALSGLR